MGVKADIARYEAKYEEKEEIRRKNKELQDAQIALEKALKEGKWLISRKNCINSKFNSSCKKKEFQLKRESERFVTLDEIKWRMLD